MRPNFETPFLLLLINKVQLSKKGMRIREQIIRDISRIKQEIDRLIHEPIKNSQSLLHLLCYKYYFLKNHVPPHIFGKDSFPVFAEFKKGGYDIHYEMSFDYFKARLQKAHIAILHMEHIRDKQIEESYENWH